MFETDIKRIQDKLRYLPSSMRPPKPVSEEEVIAFEKQHNYKLPDDYRMFIIHIGNGAEGPTHGSIRELSSRVFPNGPESGFYPILGDSMSPTVVDFNGSIILDMREWKKGTLFLGYNLFDYYERWVDLNMNDNHFSVNE